MEPANRSRVGIIDAGSIRQAMAQTALRGGRSVAIANTRGPESLTSVVSGLGDGVSAASEVVANLVPGAMQQLRAPLAGVNRIQLSGAN
jgi:predicted dinucleotide-binding enzyme